MSVFFFFFKQKTAYEMRISDWSSDVCSSDLHRLERAIDNVIDNAISFSPDAGLVCIAATRLGDEVHVRVDDDGPGIDPAHRDEIGRASCRERVCQYV